MDPIKFEPQQIKSIITLKFDNPIFIVGLGPGKQRKNEKTQCVWEGNRSGDLLQEIIVGYSNLYLTNVVNYYVKGKFSEEILKDGLENLRKDIVKFDPKKIICLGAFAYKSVLKVKGNFDENKIVQYQHPSYIIRFNKSRKDYVELLRNELS